MMIGKEGQLLVVIPCEFIHQRGASEDGWGHGRPTDHQSSTQNITETDLEAAQQLLQLSSHSFESAEGEEEGEGASSSVAKKSFEIDSNHPDGRRAPLKSASRAPIGRGDRLFNRRQLTVRDTTDGVDGGARCRYKPISHIYDITSPTSLGAGRRKQRAVKRRKYIAL